MIQMIESTATAKPRKRATAKPSSRPASAKQKLTLYVSVEAAQRLAVHATMTGSDRSAVIEAMIRDQLRRFVVADRERAKSAGQLDLAEEEDRASVA
jgi:Ribbon-helix-helix protein, copG family